jgi:hypothetical protein
MSRMRRATFRRDVYDWAKGFLAALQQTKASSPDIDGTTPFSVVSSS